MVSFLKILGDKLTSKNQIKEKYGEIPVFLEKTSFYLSENTFYSNANKLGLLGKNLVKLGSFAFIKVKLLH